MPWILLGAMAGAVIWVVILLLPWRPWSTRERLDSEARPEAADLSDVTVLIPARNEADTLKRTLRALKVQGEGLRVVVVDDQSCDGTSDVAVDSELPDLTVVPGQPVPAGWSGKVWALEQGRKHLTRPITLLLDADIELCPGFLPQLRKKMKQSGNGLVSLMAELPMNGFWERLLIPPFVYFFKLLYPFHLSNRTNAKVAAAAGGCMLVQTRLLDEIGGFGAIKDAFIDDCALAHLAKARGYGTWIGLTRSASSVRPYRRLADIWHMVARTAYTQLHYSVLWLLVCSALMLAAFVAPVAGLMTGLPKAVTLGAIALSAMMLSYLPTLRYYGLSGRWALGMPLIGVLYLAMTWTSALHYWRGRRSSWKGRTYARSPA